MASKWRGGRGFRNLMKNMPEAMRLQMVDVLDRGGRNIVAAMKARAPRRTGALIAGLKYRVLPKSLRLQVGLLGTPRGRARLFYGRIQDLGRRAQVVTVTRRRAGAPQRLVGGRKPAADVGKPYKLRVRAMAPKRFVTGQYAGLRGMIGAALRGIWDRGLRSIAGGSDD